MAPKAKAKAGKPASKRKGKTAPEPIGEALDRTGSRPSAEALEQARKDLANAEKNFLASKEGCFSAWARKTTWT